MSALQKIENAYGKNPPPEVRKAIAILKRRNRLLAANLKLIRKANDKQARTLLTLYWDKNFYNQENKNLGHWKNAQARDAFRRLMATRNRLHQKIADLVPERTDPEFDSP